MSTAKALWRQNLTNPDRLPSAASAIRFYGRVQEFTWHASTGWRSIARANCLSA
ncbi:hypothetical protein JW998_13140 [candidate division KSB1 bacterium]|nr:hypothetical protein [candidate division KSB1 bacterium]